MYGGIPPSFCSTDAKQRCDIFGPVFRHENALPPFSYTEGLLFLEIRISILFYLFIYLFAVHCVVEASNFSLNHNLALESKQNSAEDPQRRKIYLFIFFIPEL